VYGTQDALFMLRPQQTSHQHGGRINGGINMKTLELQLITVGLDDGQQGIFVGLPLLTKQKAETDGAVENIWFSDIKTVPESLTMEELMEIVRKQMYESMGTVQ
jgi:hypothetical protein